MMKRRVLICTLIFLLMTGGCLGGRKPTKGDVFVYVAVPLSGFQANGGQTVLGGVRLAAEEINRSGGLLGYRVVVRPLDDESDSDVALSQVTQIEQALNQGERVVAVIGHLNSGQTLAAMEVYKTLPLIVITPTASEQSLTERGYTNFFRVNASDDVQAAVDARFLTEYLKVKDIAVIHNNTEYGKGLADSLIEEITDRGAQAVVQLEVEEGQGSYTEEVKQIRASNPEAVFYAGYEIEAPYLRYELVNAGLDLPLLGSDGVFLAASIDEAAGSAEGMYVSAFAPSPRYVADEKWFEAYQVVEYRNPDTYSVNGYLAMQVLAAGVQHANTLDSDGVADALRREKLETMFGELSYESNCDLSAPNIWVYQVVNQEFEQVDW